MLVIVNGSPTKDFQVERGLRQGDQLSRFLFILVTKGLARLINKVAENDDFMGFKVNDPVEYRSLQFANDTFIFGTRT